MDENLNNRPPQLEEPAAAAGGPDGSPGVDNGGSLLKKSVAAVDGLSKFCGWLGAPLPFICAFIIVYEIIMRSVFQKPTPWVAETTAMLCAACYFLGGAWNIKIDGHVRVDILYSKFSPRVRAGVSCLNFAFFALYIGFMLRVIYPYVRQSIQLNESSYTFWNPLVWPLKIVLFAGFILVLLQGLANFCRDLHHLITGREL